MYEWHFIFFFLGLLCPFRLGLSCDDRRGSHTPARVVTLGPKYPRRQEMGVGAQVVQSVRLFIHYGNSWQTLKWPVHTMLSYLVQSQEYHKKFS